MAVENPPRFGGIVSIWVARLGLIYCACAAVWRAALYVFSEVGDVPLEVPEASLTFMPITDTAFAIAFLVLAAIIGRPLRSWMLELGIIVGGLHVAALAAYFVIFYGWTGGAAMSLDRPSTYLHIFLPIAVCAFVAGRMAQITWRLRRQQRVLVAR